MPMIACRFHSELAIAQGIMAPTGTSWWGVA